MRPLDARLVPHLKPARVPLIGALAASLVGGLLTLAQAFAVGHLIVSLVSNPASGAWRGAAGWLALIVVLRAVCGYAADTGAAAAASRVGIALRDRLMSAAGRVDATALSQHRTGELALLATRGTAAVEPYLTRYLPSLVLATVLPPTTLLAILWLDWPSGVIVLCTLPLVPLFAILIGISTRDRAQRQWRQLSALSGHFLDVVRGLPTLVVNRRAGAQGASIRTVTDRYRRATLDTLKIAFASSVALELVATLSVALVAVSVGLRLASGSLDFRTALTVLLLAPEAYWPLRRVGAEFHAAAEGTATFEAASAFLDLEPPLATATTDAPAAGPITLQDLSVAYGTRPVLSGVSATLPSPGLTAIIGPSGCGKSTLLATLTGELRPTAGTVRIGDGDQDWSDLDGWRRQVAWSAQRPWLTPGTIVDNIRIGRPEATEADVWRALHQVGLDLTVAALPLGLHTPLGEDGAGLSAGQRARVALARVVVAQRPYVFLDEPTAHLDAESEAALLDTLRWLAERSCVVVVAHRAPVADAADLVLSLPAASEATTSVALVPQPVTSLTGPAENATETATETEKPRRTPSARTSRLCGLGLGALSVASGVALTATAAWLITRASQHPPVLMLMVAIVGVRTFGLARPALRYAERLVSHDAALRMLAERRAAVYDALVPLVPGRLGVRRGDLLASVVDDVDALVDEELRVRQPLWTAALVGLGAVTFAALVTPVAGLVVTGLVTITALAALLARTGVRRSESAFIEHRAALSAQVEQLLHQVRDLALWQATAPALADLNDTGERLAASARRSAAAPALGRAIVLLASGAALITMAAVVPAGATSPAMLALLVLLPLALADALLPAVDAAALSVRTRACRERLTALTTLTPAVSDRDDAREVSAHSPALVARDVSAGWDERIAVSGVSLDLGSGQRIGIVGPSGCGKSTLAALLVRFIDPAVGRVDLEHDDLRALALDEVRRVVGLVDDDPYVFSSNLVENVRLARPAADDDEVEQALRAAHLGPWLDALPDGLATMVGEGNAQVSGGERARIGIARALLADQPVLVLDEPTAHLDSATAQAVSDDILAATSGRSVVWITHGSIGLDRMDEILQLNAAWPPVQRAAIGMGTT
ncbi:thiol reductant ABC exporter subunit CydD [Nocardioides sp.]|uniref:thiol reductant ABC exporter subunit CydD n=1 Tax=Nocardioides sp. TaxID=35761 RepID=UPI003D0F43CD